MEMRLRHARELLETSSVTVMEAAHLSGFADRSNFSKYFTRAFGISPAAYRKQG
jgi:transcriptional regulator GlxA family with amidase domain